MSDDTPSPLRRYRFAIFLLIAGTVVGVYHNRTTDKSKPDPVVVVVRSVFAPPANALGTFSRWVSRETGWIFHGRSIAQENLLLKQQVAELESKSAVAEEATLRYEHLRSDLGFVQKAQPRLLAADLVTRRPDPKFDTLVISRGSGDGVHVDSVVTTKMGLVGRVFETTPTTASVLLITDQNSGVGARVQRAQSRATGVIKGDNTSSLSMIYLPQAADIKPGDKIVTSGLGGIFPPGLVIGTVKTVRADTGNSLKIATITPQVDPDTLEEVYVAP